MALCAVNYWLQNYKKPHSLHTILSYISNATKREARRAGVGKTPGDVKIGCQD